MLQPVNAFLLDLTTFTLFCLKHESLMHLPRIGFYECKPSMTAKKTLFSANTVIKLRNTNTYIIFKISCNKWHYFNGFKPNNKCMYQCTSYPKSVPLQAWSGAEGSRKLRFPDYMTTAQHGGKVVSLTHRPLLPPGNTPGTHFC